MGIAYNKLFGEAFKLERWMCIKMERFTVSKTGSVKKTNCFRYLSIAEAPLSAVGGTKLWHDTIAISICMLFYQ